MYPDTTARRAALHVLYAEDPDGFVWRHLGPVVGEPPHGREARA